MVTSQVITISGVQRCAAPSQGQPGWSRGEGQLRKDDRNAKKKKLANEFSFKLGFYFFYISICSLHHVLCCSATHVRGCGKKIV